MISAFITKKKKKKKPTHKKNENITKQEFFTFLLFHYKFSSSPPSFQPLHFVNGLNYDPSFPLQKEKKKRKIIKFKVEILIPVTSESDTIWR